MNPYLRIFAPRVVIYLVIALVMAFMMHRYGNLQRESGKTMKHTRTIRQPDTPELKAALRGNPKPIIVVISSEEGDLAPVVAAAQKECGDGCHIIHIASNSDSAMKNIFKVKRFPAAILFDAANQEVQRQEGAVDAYILKKFCAAAAAQPADNAK